MPVLVAYLPMVCATLLQAHKLKHAHDLRTCAASNSAHVIQDMHLSPVAHTHTNTPLHPHSAQLAAKADLSRLEKLEHQVDSTLSELTAVKARQAEMQHKHDSTAGLVDALKNQVCAHLE